MAQDSKPTVAVLAQQLTDHLSSCEKLGALQTHRLGRIEGILISVAAGLILQLLAVVAFLFVQAYPPARAQVAAYGAAPAAISPR